MLRTRPDITAAACLVTRNPSETLRLRKQVWRYLKGTLVEFEPESANESWVLKVFSDASFSPGGRRSRSGIAIALKIHFVYWRSCKQQLTAWSATESELEAMTEALCVALKFKHTLEEVLGILTVGILQRRDNQGAITLALRENYSWLAVRTRHYALRLAGLRDMLVKYQVVQTLLFARGGPTAKLTEGSLHFLAHAAREIFEYAGECKAPVRLLETLGETLKVQECSACLPSSSALRALEVHHAYAAWFCNACIRWSVTRAHIKGVVGGCEKGCTLEPMLQKQ